MVACVWLIPMTWTYGGLPFGVARPEHVASHPDYRRRGLIRELFKAIHARSTADGDLAQAITGIPYYYRQFDYEYAVDLGGGRTVALADIPELGQGETEPFGVRPADLDDVAFLAALFNRDHQRSLVANVLGDDYWRWMLNGINHESGLGWCALVITDSEARPCGYVLLRSRRWGSSVNVLHIAVSDGTSMQAAIRPILRAIRDQASTIPTMQGSLPAKGITFELGESHPVYGVLSEGLAPRVHTPSAWYIRVPDLPAFLRHISPVLEQRLVGSPVAGYTGELPLDFYRGGLKLSFTHGRFVAAEVWQRPIWGQNPEAGFPPLVFLQLVFGRRALHELRHVLPDVWATDEAEPILNVLFPKRYSHVMPIH